MDRVLRVVVVDDSAYVRKVVREILSRSPFVEVVGTARDGREALDLVEQLDPDVVTCDLIMPELDGVGFVREQMQRRPVPIIIMSIANETAEAALTALDAGAIDFVQKPTALASEKIFEVSAELIEKVKAAGKIALNRIPTAPATAEHGDKRAGDEDSRKSLGRHGRDWYFDWWTTGTQTIDTTVAGGFSGSGGDGDAYAGRLYRDVRGEIERTISSRSARSSGGRRGQTRSRVSGAGGSSPVL